MRTASKILCLCFGVLTVLECGAVAAADWQRQPPQPRPLPNVNSLPVGFKFCPAPGADNSEFNSSYYAIDARTGQMSRYVDGQPRNDLEPVNTREEVLFIAPTIDVQNKYVPYPGGRPQQPPREFANSDHGDNPQYWSQGARTPQQHYAQRQPRAPRRNPARPPHPQNRQRRVPR